MSETINSSVWFENSRLRSADIIEQELITQKVNEVYSGYGLIGEKSNPNGSEEDADYYSESQENIDNSNDLGYLEKIFKFDFKSDPKIKANEISKTKGFITEIGANCFQARLIGEEGTYETVEFENGTVSEEDFPLFKNGAVFYWIFGLFTIKKQRQKMSIIRFQRIAPLNTREFDELIDKAEKLNDALDWN